MAGELIIGIDITELVRDAGFLLSFRYAGEFFISVARLYNLAADS